MKKIPLTQGKFTVVDDKDFDWLNKWKWTYDGNPGYAYRKIWIGGMGRKEKKVYMHRQIMDLPVKKVIDHINRDKLDNRRHNLRVCLQRQNCKNHIRHKNNKSGFKGVSLDKRSNKWVVEIMTNGKRYLKKI